MSALVNPIEAWAQVFQTAFANTANIGSMIAADPAPILSTIGENQLLSTQFLAAFAEGFASGYLTAVGQIPATVEAAIAQIQNGQIDQGFANLLLGTTVNPFVAAIFGQFASLAYLPGVLSNPAQNVANVIATATNIGTLVPLIGVLTGVLGPVLQIGFTGQEIYNAIEADDVEAALNAVINFPADLVNTTLNGNPAIPSGGLLGPYNPAEVSGVITALLSLRPVIADVINPPALPSAAKMSMTFTPDAANETGIEGLGITLPAEEGSPSPGPGEGEVDDAAKVAAVETTKDSDKVTNKGAVLPFLNRSGTSLAGSNGASSHKPGQRLQAAFEGTVDRIEKGFKDAADGIDKAFKSLGNRDKKDDGAGASGADAGAGSGSGSGAGAGAAAAS